MKKRRKVLICYKCGGKGHPAKVCPTEDDVQDVDEAESDQQENLMGGIEWADDSCTDLNEVRYSGDKDPARQPLLAFIDSGAVDNVLPKDVCAHVPLEKTARSRSGMGFRGANGAHIHHYGQRRFPVETELGNVMNTRWEVADVRKPLISAARVLEKGHRLVLDDNPRMLCKDGNVIPLERHGSLFAVRLWVSRPGFTRQG